MTIQCDNSPEPRCLSTDAGAGHAKHECIVFPPHPRHRRLATCRPRRRGRAACRRRDPPRGYRGRLLLREQPWRTAGSRARDVHGGQVLLPAARGDAARDRGQQRAPRLRALRPDHAARSQASRPQGELQLRLPVLGCRARGVRGARADRAQPVAGGRGRVARRARGLLRRRLRARPAHPRRVCDSARHRPRLLSQPLPPSARARASSALPAAASGRRCAIRRRRAHRLRRDHDPLAGRRRRAAGQEPRRRVDRRAVHRGHVRDQHRRHAGALVERPLRFDAAPGGERSGRERYSIPVFYDPDYETNVECLPNCASPDNPPRYPPIVAGDYITARYDGTYSYRQKSADG